MKKKVVAIIQARVRSIRLPGKALMDISGKPMLWHVINRLKHSRRLDLIVVATTTNKLDDAIEEFCRQYDVAFYRGSETNVLDRYYKAASNYKASVVVRITSDCPFIDPIVVDTAVSELLEHPERFDIVSNTANRTYPRGLDVEVFSFSALSMCNKRATEDYQKEHVTRYIYEHPDLFRHYNLDNDTDLSHLRWTVDEIADMKFAREIYKRLFKEDSIFFMEEIIGILEKEPGLNEINRDIRQKNIL